ncbi:hypothetical protein Pmani_011016 [Petrolisthes manimaculis]|uniref:Uncharacterized protein n=1 Tax=Petrolisthes manimaculis TaxID=1843537 RepID=A0AAE1Q1Y3_9EUCA|nr:hypothetical protein Pmani_011016 [Petrolisthes manimaculis]
MDGGVREGPGVTEPRTLMDYSRLGRRPRDLQYGRSLKGASVVPGAVFGYSEVAQSLKETARAVMACIN